MKTRLLQNPYSKRVWLVWGCSRKQYEAFLKRKHGNDAPSSDGFYRGCVDEITPDDKSGSFYLWVEDGDILTIIHETNHLTYRVLVYAGVRLSIKTEEAYAYLQEHFCEQIFRAMRKK